MPNEEPAKRERKKIAVPEMRKNAELKTKEKRSAPSGGGYGPNELLPRPKPDIVTSMAVDNKMSGDEPPGVCLLSLTVSTTATARMTRNGEGEKRPAVLPRPLSLLLKLLPMRWTGPGGSGGREKRARPDPNHREMRRQMNTSIQPQDSNPRLESRGMDSMMDGHTREPRRGSRTMLKLLPPHRRTDLWVPLLTTMPTGTSMVVHHHRHLLLLLCVTS